MSRFVSGDHVLFEECIPVFFGSQVSPEEFRLEGQRVEIGYLLLDFESIGTMDFEAFQIQPTRRVDFPGAYSGFVAPVRLPPVFGPNLRFVSPDATWSRNLSTSPGPWR